MSTDTAQPLLHTSVESPIGELLLLGDGETLHGLYMQDGRKPIRIASSWTESADAFADVRAQLREYFAGERTTFDTRLSMVGNAIRASRLARALRNPLRRDRQLRRDRTSSRPAHARREPSASPTGATRSP